MIKIRSSIWISSLAASLCLAVFFLYGTGWVRAQALPSADIRSQAPATAAPEAPLPQRTLIAGFHASPPFVMANRDRPAGMAVELWEAAAERLELKYTYKPYETISEMLQATADGTIDIALANLTVSSSRLQRLDFSQPWYDSGMRIMIKENRATNFGRVIERLRKSGHLQSYFWLGAILLAATLILTLIDRRFDKDFTRSWVDGLSDNFYQVVSAASTGKATHKPIFGAFGRVFSGLWVLSGVAFIAYITSSVASTMTAVSLTSEISGHADLSRRIVGVQAGSAGATYAQLMALETRTYPDTGAAITDLLDEKIDAVLDDAPVLEYYDNSHPELPLTVVGGIIRPEKYGFALTKSSPLTRPLSVLLTEFRETGFLEKLDTKYFGVTR